MTRSLLGEHFDDLLASPEDVVELNNAILQLAIQGKLVAQAPTDEPASEIIRKVIKPNEKIEILDRSEILFDIPASWSWVHLGDLGVTQTGSTPPTSNPGNYGSDYPFVRPADISDGFDLSINYRHAEGLSKSGIENCRLIKPDSIMMVCIGSVGKVGIVDRECACNQQINILTPYVGLNAKLLTAFMRSPYFQKEAVTRASKTTLPILNKSKWTGIPIPLPPVAEQKRIIARVEELFALTRVLAEQLTHSRRELDLLNKSALAHLLASETPEEFNEHWAFIAEQFDLLFQAPEHVAPLRQSILELAVRGKLTHREAGDESVKELLRKAKDEKDKFAEENNLRQEKSLPSVQEDEKRFDLPKYWEWVRLDDVCIKITDGFHETPTPTSQGYPYVLATHVKSNGIDFRNCLYVSETDHKRLFNKATPRNGDVLVVSIGAGSATPAIIDVEFEFSFKNVAILNKATELDTKYLFYYLLAVKQSVFDEITRGGAQPYLSLRMLRNLVMPLPPLAEQERIVKHVDELLALCDALEAGLRSAEEERGKLVAAVMSTVGVGSQA